MPTSFWRFFQSEPNATLLPVLLTLCTDLRILADKADEVLIKSAQEEDTRKGDALSSLRAIFSNLIKDNQKKIGVLGVVNNLFRIFFKVNKKTKICNSIQIFF